MPGAREEFDIVRVATLARLRLSPGEASLYARQLGDILAFVEQLGGVEAKGMPAEAHPQVPPAAGRRDEATPSLPVDAALGSAPDVLDAPRLVRVPKVMG